jgi:N-acetylglutamate synthase-like GNAT family acetyltransferase
VGGLSAPTYRVRRATLEDLGVLTKLWASMSFPTDDLVRRVTEFQVVEAPGGGLLGGLGLHIAERQGQIHSEGFTDFSVADIVRPMLWERINSLATNYGLHRLWTTEAAPFWKHCGLAPADADALQKLPTPWRNQTGTWLTLKLREDLEAVLSTDKELALFMEMERRRSQNTLEKARLVKTVATAFGVIFALLLFSAAVYLVLKHPGALPRP